MSSRNLFYGLAGAAALAFVATPALTSTAEAAPRHAGKHWNGGHGWKHHGGWRHGHRWHHGPRYGYRGGWAPGFVAGFGLAAPAYGYYYGPRCGWKAKRYGHKWVCR